MTETGRIEVDGGDYFGHQKKKLQFADRRPVIRRPSDLVGPGIAANSVRITDFNDLLATFNGYFGADEGAANAPTSTQAYVGTTTSDSLIGGAQVFYGMEDQASYRRVFTRSPLDPSAIFWGDWESVDVTSLDMDARLDVIESQNLNTRMGAVESDVAVLEAGRKPLYTGTLLFFMTAIPPGTVVFGDATFPVGAFSSAPAAWAIKSGFVTGSTQVVVSACDQVTASGCRVVLINIGPSNATFTDLPIRWFAHGIG